MIMKEKYIQELRNYKFLIMPACIFVRTDESI